MVGKGRAVTAVTAGGLLGYFVRFSSYLRMAAVFVRDLHGLFRIPALDLLMSLRIDTEEDEKNEEDENNYK